MTSKKYAAIHLGILLGTAALVVAGLYRENAEASRNASGTYSLPAGNPVVSGATISSTTHNNTMSDISTELTDSLSRSGKGAMLAALQGYAGTVSAPGFTFDADTDTGLYRIGANNLGVAVNGTKLVDVATTGVTLPLGATFTQSQSNTAAVTATGNGSAAGVVGTGGGTNANGGTFTGGATNGKGVVGTGAGSGAGGSFANGTAASGATPRNAVEVTNGYVGFSGVTSPDSTTGVTNTLTPANTVKAWASVDITGATFAVTIDDGFNIASGSRVDANTARLTIADDMASANYAVSALCNGGVQLFINARAAGSFDFDPTAGSFDGASGLKCTFILIGRQ
jgi:hypothetical protein